MKILHNMTIRHKLTVVIMFTCIMALLLAGTALVLWGRVTFRRDMVRNLSTLAQITAENCKAALAFEDVDDATETLKALRAQNSVVLAEIHTKSGEEFAFYSRDGIDKHPPVAHQEDGYNFNDGLLIVFKSIILDGEVIGGVCLQSDLSPLYAMLKSNTIIIASIILFASIVAYLVSSAAQKVISGPILSLAQVAKNVSEKKDYSTRVQRESNDEVGLLVTAFNEMLDQIQQQQAVLVEVNEQLEDRVRQRTAELEETHKKLMETSHQAGMAEVATDVLHNVGNVLNSINVAATLIREKVAGSEVANLKKVTDIISDNSDDLATFLTKDQRGIHIPAFLSEVSKALIEEQADNIDKLRSLAENIEHIKEIVKMQQSYARVSGVEVTTSISELVDNAIQINAAAVERHGIHLVRDFEDLVPATIDKQKVLQILVNLISNAKYAMSKNEENDKNMVIHICEHDPDKVRIEVIDNGTGIPKENLTKIFNHGFTTKKDGHGFGLHSSAIAAKELGGSLTVRSEGEGKGAMFILELPFKPVEVLG
jgi:two-component system NtrC family sensor kinase